MSGHWIDTPVRAYLAEPPHGAGPGLLLFGATTDLADMLAQEGYVVLAGPADANPVAAVETLRSRPPCKGKLGALGYGIGSTPALQAANDHLVDCLVLTDPPDASATTDLPCVIHLAAAAPPHPDTTKIYLYAEGQTTGSMAYSRTLALLRRELGPHFDLDALWEAHRAHEFITRDAYATMRTMVAEPYVNHVPTMTGGFGQIDLHRFYRDHFIPNNPKDMRNIPISRTVGADRVVNEGILCFTHDTQIDWLLPGIPPTGKYVEVALIGIITFRGDKLVHEHIYWDQASVLVQVGLLDPTKLPVAGAAAARKVMDPTLPSNALLPGWTA